MDQYVHVSSGGLDCLILRGAWANVAGAIYYVGFETQCAAYKYFLYFSLHICSEVDNQVFNHVKTDVHLPGKLMEIVNAMLLNGFIILVGPKVPEDI